MLHSMGRHPTVRPMRPVPVPGVLAPHAVAGTASARPSLNPTGNPGLDPANEPLR